MAAPAHEGGAVAAAVPWGGGGLARRHPELQPIAAGVKAADPVVGAAAAEKDVVGIAAPHERGGTDPAVDRDRRDTIDRTARERRIDPTSKKEIKRSSRLSHYSVF